MPSGGLFCGIPNNAIDVFFCTFFIYLANENTGLIVDCKDEQDLAKQCFIIQSGPLLTTSLTTEAETQATDLPTNVELVTSEPSEAET